MLAVKNGKTYVSGGSFGAKNLFVENGRFVPGNGNAAEVLDASGCYVIPGLTDIHFHGAVGVDVVDGTDEAFETLAKYEAVSGVTQICPANDTESEEVLTEMAKCAYRFAYRQNIGMLQETAEDPGASENGADPSDPAYASLVGLHLEGPFFCYEKRGAQNPAFLRDPDVAMAERLRHASGALFRIMDLAPELPGSDAFIQAEKEHGVISFAHSAAGYDIARHAMELGITHMTHLYNGMMGIAHRAPGPVMAAFDMPFVHSELICDGVHVKDPVVRATFRLLGRERVIMISDSLRVAGRPDGEFEFCGRRVIKKGNLCTLEDGTIAGSCANLMQGLQNAVRVIGIPIADAVLAAAENPIREIGLFDSFGSLDEGKWASFVLLDENDLSIRAVVNRGVRIR